MSIAPPVGAMSAYLARAPVGPAPIAASAMSASRFAKQLPRRLKGLRARASRPRNIARGMVTGGTLFEELGFYYVGPIDGHNLDTSAARPEERPRRDRHRPDPVHVVTKKGKGYAPAESQRRQVSRRGPSSTSSPASRPSPSPTRRATPRCSAKPDREAAEVDDKIVAITAAMPSGTGLDCSPRLSRPHLRRRHRRAARRDLRRRPRDRRHEAVRAIYSTFLQRAYDQVVHDVAIQGLPVRFAIDRAGPGRRRRADPCRLVRRRLSRRLPGIVVMAAADEAELVHMVATAAAIDDRPSAFRYPRGDGVGVECRRDGDTPLEIGKGRILREGTTVALLASARASANASRPPTSSPPMACPPRWPMRASPSRSTPISSAASRASTSADRQSRRAHRRLRQPCRGLPVIDATCPLVAKVHAQARRYEAQGRQVVLIGHSGHPEVIGTLGQVERPALLISTVRAVEALDVPADRPIAYVTQTTLSVDDTRDVIAALERRFVDIVGPDVSDICYATQNRQTAVRALCRVAELILVVGAANSSNSTRLREIGTEQGRPSYLVADGSQIRREWFDNVAVVGLAAGASAPEVLVDDVIAAMRRIAPLQTSVMAGPVENTTFRLPRELAAG
jgi:4-hydroxy-3-methylbut-2-enyl diphosphate reductase